MPELTETEEELRIYEFCVLYPANLSQKEESTLLKEIEKTIEEQGGTQVSKDMWGKRGLAYGIKGHDEGNFVVYHYNLDPSKVKEIDVTLRIMPNLLRHIVVKPPKGYEVVKFSEKYEQWLKDKEAEVVKKEKEKEERLAKKVAERAKQKAKKTAAAVKKEEQKTEKPAADKKKISEELEKLISDDDLDI